MKYTLKTPITHNEVTYTELTFRKAKTRDLMAADRFPGQTSKIVAILASMAGAPIQVFQEIDADEFTVIMEQAGHLMGESKTPATTGD